MTPCAREGCDNPLPKLAVLHGDSYCSSACFRQDKGFPLPPPWTAKQAAAAKANKMPRAPVLSVGRNAE
jgi:hypothetical protein